MHCNVGISSVGEINKNRTKVTWFEKTKEKPLIDDRVCVLTGDKKQTALFLTVLTGFVKPPTALVLPFWVVPKIRPSLNMERF